MTDDVTVWVKEKRDSFLKQYDHWLKKKLFFRHLVRYLHYQLNRIQYDPLNPRNRTAEAPDGELTDIDRSIERDKTLLDKIETYFRLRPVSTSILVFFVIAVAATSVKNNPEKIITVLLVILLTLPLMLSRQDDFITDSNESLTDIVNEDDVKKNDLNQ